MSASFESEGNILPELLRDAFRGGTSLESAGTKLPRPLRDVPLFFNQNITKLRTFPRIGRVRNFFSMKIPSLNGILCLQAACGNGRWANGARPPNPQPSTALCRPIPKGICSRHIRGQAAPADHRRSARRSANEKHEQQEMHMTSNHESNDRALRSVGTPI